MFKKRMLRQLITISIDEQVSLLLKDTLKRNIGTLASRTEYFKLNMQWFGDNARTISGRADSFTQSADQLSTLTYSLSCLFPPHYLFLLFLQNFSPVVL
jgi:hypothetical protein